jgi:ectoine hydroxylase-related dioxygenase (phytanoyl-CoA dioxygenase family)
LNTSAEDRRLLWGEASMTGIATLPKEATVDDVVDRLQQDGGVIVEDMLSDAILDRLWTDLGPFLRRTPFGADGFAGSRTRRCSALFAKTMAATDMVLAPHFLGAAERILFEAHESPMMEDGQRFISQASLQVSVTQAIEIWPGQAAQPLHRDDGLHHRRHPGPDSQVQVLYAGTEYTAEVGATLVVPGSHLWDDDRMPRPEEAIPAVMRRGSGLIYLGSTYHGGGANTTADLTRTAFAVSLCLGYLRQEENQYLVVPVERVKQFPPKVQALLGYAICPPFCGWVEMQDPSIVLGDDDFSVGKAMNLL